QLCHSLLRRPHSPTLFPYTTLFRSRAIEAASTSLGYASTVLPSGAGHDAAYMARLGPMGMIFIPCRDGRSHCPEEWIEPAQLWVGARVLAESLKRLDQER